ncbi:hypothetical protein AB0K15_11940 [Amycolatopsis sp. NPDC049253]|uniref:hypothetical protein n=1 Tax=Amycolatopsis sp. NPDC049253 TaxID=3155274 RepID=UPI003438DCA8
MDLPLIPVAHPYVYGLLHVEGAASPFVDRHEHHVYARGHGERLWLGTYDDRPLPVRSSDDLTRARKLCPDLHATRGQPRFTRATGS